LSASWRAKGTTEKEERKKAHLDVAVTDAKGFVKTPYNRSELLEDAPRELRRKDSAWGPRDEALERDALAEVLLDEVKVARSADRFEDLDEVGMGEELCEDGGFSKKAGGDKRVVRMELRVFQGILRRWMQRGELTTGADGPRRRGGRVPYFDVAFANEEDLAELALA